MSAVRKLTDDQVAEVKSMWEKGHTRQEIADRFNVSLFTVDRYKVGTVDNYHKGGFTSSSIPISSIEGKKIDLPKVEETVRAEETAKTILIDQTMVVAGRKTAVVFTINKKQSVVKCEGDFLCADIKLDDIPDLAGELMEVYRRAMKMQQ